MADRAKLLSVLEEVREKVNDLGADFLTSSWPGPVEATAELTSLIDALRAATMPEAGRLKIVFAPTGPLQEVAERSGWGTQFLNLANRLDSAMSEQDAVCACNQPVCDSLRALRYLGTDSQHLDSRLLRCDRCGQIWLESTYEIEGVSKSGRWFRGALSPALVESVTAADASRVLSVLPSYFVGGSHFGEAGMFSGRLPL